MQNTTDASSQYVSQWADIIILCAKDVEFEALRSVLAIEDRSTIQESGLNLEHFIIYEGYKYRILVARLPAPEAGNVISGITASKLSNAYNPWLIISFGIAGTLDHTQVKSADVVYSREVGYGDLRKEEGNEVVRKDIPKEKTEVMLLAILNGLRRKARDEHSYQFDIHPVLLLSSEAVVKSDEANMRRLASFALADAQAVEMEAYGVYRSCSYDAEAGPLAIAIKAISDKADVTKDDTLHTPATQNAAKIIRQLLEDEGFERLSVRRFQLSPTIHSRQRNNYEDARENGRAFMKDIKSVLQLTTASKRAVLDVQLSAAHMIAQRPPVFYHWRLEGDGIHWVDFCFLRVLRELAHQGYPVICFVTDGSNEPDLIVAREKVGEWVNSILMKTPEQEVLVWFSQVRQLQNGLNEFVKRTGYDYAALDDVMGQPPFRPNRPDLNHEFDLWFKWIAWSCRHEGVGIVLSRPRAATYEFLRLFGNFQPVILPTREFKLGSQPGRHQPGADLFFHPPNHPKIHDWLTNESNPETLHEFLDYISEEATSLTRVASNQDCDEARNAIVEQLDRINREWFGFSGLV